MSAEVWAYTDPANQGTQNWGGNLGLDFTVNQAVVVSALGIFNASGLSTINGGPIDVAIYDTTGTLMSPIVQFDNTGTYALAPGGFDLLQTILPFVLGPGNYSVVAVGFGSPDPNGNLNTGSGSGPALNNGGGLLTFTGYRWDGSSVLALPTANTGLVPNQFDAGTLQFADAPEPGTFALFGLGLAFAFWSRQRRHPA